MDQASIFRVLDKCERCGKDLDIKTDSYCSDKCNEDDFQEYINKEEVINE